MKVRYVRSSYIPNPEALEVAGEYIIPTKVKNINLFKCRLCNIKFMSLNDALKHVEAYHMKRRYGYEW